MDKVRLGVCICCHDDDAFLGLVISSCLAVEKLDVHVFVSTLAWDASPGGWERCAETARAAGATVTVGCWPNEALHRRSAIREMRKLGYSHAVIPDSDEVLEPELVKTLIGIARERTAERVSVFMETYFKSPEFVVRPREALTPVILLDLEKTRHVRIREFSGGRSLTLTPDYGVMHHLSYACPAGDDSRISRKISTWSHRDELVPGWEARVWRDWNPFMEDIHPTHPPAYKRIEHIRVPEILSGISLEDREEIEPSIPWPTLSFVVSLYGGEEDIRLCLESIERISDLVHETVVVDDVSPDRAACVAESFENVVLIRNEKNLGFAGANNVGYARTTGKVVVFLNSDCIVTRAGTVRLVESLMASRSIAAAGPLSNNTGHHQQISTTYGSLETMPLFADDLARSDAEETEDADVDMLVGFCLAVKREILEEVGQWDTRFGTGMFEDNDLCYRMRRSGFRLVLSKRAFVHHAGSKSLNRRREHPAVLLSRNRQIFLDKWRDDLECGFVSHLSGMSPEPIVFSERNRPEAIDRRLRKLAKKADVCLCMIVKNEQRVLGACLESARHGFAQRVVVDTGSTDGTVELARSHGVEVHQMEWPDSFSAARNASLSFARTRWNLWLDADDTIDRRSLELILEAVIRAPKHIGALIVPVRFGDGPNGGTHVDHVKIFLNLPARIQFEGHIHEQVLGSVRRAGFDIALVEGAYVLHSGYDTSAAGQKVKRARDEKHLKLDLDVDPNHPFYLFNQGMTVHHLGEHEEAVEWLAKCVAACSPTDSILGKAYVLLGISRRELGDPQAGLDTMDEGLAVVPLDPELLFQSAKTLHQLGRLEDARQRYIEIPSEVPRHLGSIDRGILTHKRFHNLGDLCMEMGRYAEARDWWRKATQSAPSVSASATNLFEAAVAQGDIRTAREALDAMRAAEGPSEGWALRLARLASETGQDPESALRGAMQSFPYSAGLLAVLSRMLVQRGDESGAVPLLSEMERLGSAEGAFFLGLIAVRRLDLWAGLEHFVRARELNAEHEPTHQQISELSKILEAEPPPPLEASGEEVLKGPHIGELGPGTGGTSVVVVTYNSVCTIGECAQSALASMGEADELILVDNDSKDGTVHLLKAIAESDSRVRLILNAENLGYSRAANIGMLSSARDRIVTLNPDAYVSPGWLESMSAHLKDGVAAVGPMSDNIGGDQFVGHLLNGRRPPLEDLASVLATERKGRSQDTKFLVGICVMVRRETLDAHGLLDEGTELGADDLEFSWRSRMLGQRLVIAQDVFVRHEQGVSFASLPNLERGRRQRRSDAWLVRKLEAYYGKGNIPSSMVLWGTPIFEEALGRFRLLGL